MLLSETWTGFNYTRYIRATPIPFQHSWHDYLMPTRHYYCLCQTKLKDINPALLTDQSCNLPTDMKSLISKINLTLMFVQEIHS